MKLISTLFTLLGFLVVLMWGAGALGIADFRLTFGPHTMFKKSTVVDIKLVGVDQAIQLVRKKIDQFSG